MKAAAITLKAAVIALFLTFINSNISIGQSSKNEKDSVKQAEVSKLVDQKEFVFLAEYASPLKGGRRFLSSGYTLTVANDTIISDLPYFGRVYQASLSSSGGLRFTITGVDYKVFNRKKGGWDISIRLKSASNVQELNFTIFGNGRASLIVNSIDRQQITFDGTIEKRKWHNK